MELRDHLRTLEGSLLRNAVRKNAAQVDALLAEDFREFGASGRTYTKAEMIAHLRDEAYAPIFLTCFELKSLSTSLALVTYRAVREESGGKVVESWRNSLWELRDGRWQMVFHQGTKIPAK
jgi:hypothetical protein